MRTSRISSLYSCDSSLGLGEDMTFTVMCMGRRLYIEKKYIRKKNLPPKPDAGSK